MEKENKNMKRNMKMQLEENQFNEPEFQHKKHESVSL